MAKPKEDKTEVIRLEGVTFKRVSTIGERLNVGLKIKVSRSVTDARMRKCFCEKQVNLTMIGDPGSKGDAPGQQTLAGDIDSRGVSIEMVAECSGYGVRSRYFNVSLLSMSDSVDMNALREICGCDGVVDVSVMGAKPDRRLAATEEGDDDVDGESDDPDDESDGDDDEEDEDEDDE